ncbi:MAG: hypothetical protein JJU28_12195 [Cyclobacteriaceae bacterium]|nr:hypothetical protein [Cyclobacteriaceae bacterium]
MINAKHKKYLLLAFTKTFEGMRNNKGGPFGAVVVKDGTIIGNRYNSLTS